MSIRGSSIGFFGMFGRSSDLRQLDDGLRAVDVHPRLVTEAVKLAAVKFLKEDAGSNELPASTYRDAAALIGYCVIGAESFAGANDVRQAEAIEHRIEAALAGGDSVDAQLILLLLHAKAVQQSVIETFGLESV